MRLQWGLMSQQVWHDKDVDAALIASQVMLTFPYEQNILERDVKQQQQQQQQQQQR